MRAAAAFVALATLGGCNQILGNGNFTGPGGPIDAAFDACTAVSCPPDAMADAGVDASMTCQQMGKPSTTISGTVYAPNGTLPLPNAVVYVPRTAPDPITPGVSCGCVTTSGGAVTSTITDDHGHFVLTDPPTGANVPVVIQLGKWRRQIVVPSVETCADTALTAMQTHLPKNHVEGDLPSIAISTGAADELECLVRQLGIDDSEIGSNGDGRRVQLLTGFQPGVMSFAGGFPGGAGPFSSLASTVTDPTKLNSFDRVMLSCEGTPAPVNAAQATAMTDWANAGGQLLLEHYARGWMTMSPPWQTLATFVDGSNPPPNGVTVTIDQTFPSGTRLASWLLGIAASTTNGQIQVQNARNSVQNADAARVQIWAHLDPAQAAGLSGDQIFSFPTPLGVPPANQCGRVVFSDMHQTGTGSIGGVQFPNECLAGNLTPQQDVLAFLFYDERTCIGP